MCVWRTSECRRGDTWKTDRITTWSKNGLAKVLLSETKLDSPKGGEPVIYSLSQTSWGEHTTTKGKAMGRQGKPLRMTWAFSITDMQKRFHTWWHGEAGLVETRPVTLKPDTIKTWEQGGNPLACKHPGVFPTHGNLVTGAHLSSRPRENISGPTLLCQVPIALPAPVAQVPPLWQRGPWPWGPWPSSAPVRAGRCHFVAPQARTAPAAPAGLRRHRPPPREVAKGGTAGTGTRRGPALRPRHRRPRALRAVPPARTTFPGSEERGPAGAAGRAGGSPPGFPERQEGKGCLGFFYCRCKP